VVCDPKRKTCRTKANPRRIFKNDKTSPLCVSIITSVMCVAEEAKSLSWLKVFGSMGLSCVEREDKSRVEVRTK